MTFRPLELAPIIQKWMDGHPGVDVADFIRDSIRNHPDAKMLAGKRWAHLLDA